jgi:hypothetical protein
MNDRVCLKDGRLSAKHDRRGGCVDLQNQFADELRESDDGSGGFPDEV